MAVGFVGIIVMLWPYFDISHFTAGTASAAIGAACAVASTFTNAGSVIQTRRPDHHGDHVVDRVLFLRHLRARRAGHAAVRLGHAEPRCSSRRWISIGFLGGLAHVVLTESYHHAPASLVAPLDYTTMIWAFILGYWMFGEIPSVYVYVGSAIVAASGIFVIWRERQLGLRRNRGRGPHRADLSFSNGEDLNDAKSRNLCGPIRRTNVTAAAQGLVMVKDSVPRHGASSLRRTALESCRAQNFKVGVSVVDRGGHVLVTLRDHGAAHHTVELAQRKAYTSRIFRQSSKDFSQRLRWTTRSRPGLVL